MAGPSNSSYEAAAAYPVGDVESNLVPGTPRCTSARAHPPFATLGQNGDLEALSCSRAGVDNMS